MRPKMLNLNFISSSVSQEVSNFFYHLRPFLLLSQLFKICFFQSKASLFCKLNVKNVKCIKDYSFLISTVQHCKAPYSPVKYSPVKYSPVQPRRAQFIPVQPSTAQYSAVQQLTAQYSPVQSSTVQYSSVQSSTAQYN